MSFLIGLLMISGLAQAADPANCPDRVEVQDNTQIQLLWSPFTETCFLSLVPYDAYIDLLYRDYLFITDGLFMVFNSYGAGNDESTLTGAREFYMFPRPNPELSYRWIPDLKQLEVTHVTGDKFLFDTRKARLLSITRAQVTVADEVLPDNKGGVEISNFQGLLLDVGFKKGSAASGNPNGTAVMKDGVGNTCSVKNNEIFVYNSTGDNAVKFTDKELNTFLKKRCPRLKLPSL